MLSAYYWRTYSSYHLLFFLKVKGCLCPGIPLKLPHCSNAPFRCSALPVLQTPGSKQLHPTQITSYKTAGFVWSAAVQLQQVLLSTSNSTEWLSRASKPLFWSWSFVLLCFLQAPDFALVSWLHCVGNSCHRALQDKGLPKCPVSSCAASFKCEHTISQCSDWTAIWLLSVNF